MGSLAVQCCIDLGKNVLRLHEGERFHEVPFLPEHVRRCIGLHLISPSSHISDLYCRKFRRQRTAPPPLSLRPRLAASPFQLQRPARRRRVPWRLPRRLLLLEGRATRPRSLNWWPWVSLSNGYVELPRLRASCTSR